MTILEMKNETKNETKNFRLVVGFQFHDNYGAHSWDGKGACPQNWKSKGGIDVVVDLGPGRLTTNQIMWPVASEVNAMLTKIVAEKEGTNDEYSTMFYADHCILSPGEMTPEESRDAEWRSYMKS